MRSGTAIAVCGALFALLFFSSGAAAKKPSIITSKGEKRARSSSYDGDAKRWAQKRYTAAHDYLEKYWGSALAGDGLRDAALSVVAHWALETGSGAAESNWNVGNIHAVGTQAWYGGDDTNPATGKPYGTSFAAYDSLGDGVAAYFKLLEDGYPTSMQKLVSDPESSEWFKQLGRSGYYAATMKGKDNLEPAAAGWAARRAVLAKYAQAGE